MVVEHLTFAVEAELLDRWIERDERCWTRFLAGCDGFVAKEVWVPPAEDRSATGPIEVRIVVWWESDRQWKAISVGDLRAVAEEMGALERAPTMRRFDRVRSTGSTGPTRHP